MTQIPIEAKVECTDGPCGKSVAVTVDPVRRQVTHIVVDDKTTQRLVPMDQVAATSSETIHLRCTQAQLAEMPPFVVERFVPVEPGLGEEAYRYYALPLVTGLESAPPMLMVDEQVPSGELAVHRGMPVEAKDGQVGKVGELVVDPQSGEITHFVLQEGHLWGKKELTLPLSAIELVAGDTVYLRLDKQAIGQLPAIPVRRQHLRRVDEPAKIDLVAVAFDAPDDASRALQFIEQFRKKGTLKILNAAVLVKDAEGNVIVKDTRDIDPKKGRLLGAVTGGLIGLVGGPVGAVVGALTGAGAGGLAGKKIDLGFSEQFLDGLKQYLKPNTSALIVLVEHGYYEQLSDVIAEEEGVFFRQTLTDKLVEQLLTAESE